MKLSLFIILFFMELIFVMNTQAQIKETVQHDPVKLTIVNPTNLYDPEPNGYSHSVIASGVSRIAYISGQGGENIQGELSPDFSNQVKQAYKNLHAAISAVGGDPQQVTKITTYVVGYDQSILRVMTEEVKRTFGESLPAQTLVPVPRLALDGMLFEVDAVVALD